MLYFVLYYKCLVTLASTMEGFRVFKLFEYIRKIFFQDKIYTGLNCRKKKQNIMDLGVLC